MSCDVRCAHGILEHERIQPLGALDTVPLCKTIWI